ncbi:MAG: Rap1a/Tai family immunity protein [Halioglobus sp.]
MRKLFFVLILSVLWGQSVLAEKLPTYISGNDLLGACESSAPDITFFCHGYIAGIVDTYSLYGENSKAICMPEGVPVSQLALIVTKYLHQYPELLHETASYRVIYAMVNAFPCE